MATGDVALAEVVDAAVPDISSGNEVDTVDTPTVDNDAVIEPNTDTTDTTDTDTGAVDDSRTIPQQWRDLFKADSKLRGVYFAERAFREAFPQGPNQAKQTLAEVAELTGEYGVTSLPEVAEAISQQRAQWDQLDQWYETGDANFVKSISEEGPEQFAKMIPMAVDQLATTNKPAYDHLMSRILVNTIDQTSPLGEIWNLLNATDNTKPAAKLLADWYNGLKGLADKQPERKENPEAVKLQREREEWQQEKQQTFETGVRDQRVKDQVSFIHNVLKKEYAGIGQRIDDIKAKDPESYWAIMENCNQAIGRAIAKDDKFQRQFMALLKKGDGAGALRLAKGKIESPALGTAAVQKTFQLFRRSFGGAKPGNVKPQPKPGEQPSNGEVQLAKAPSDKEMDWARIRATYRKHGFRDEGEMVLSGQAYVKGRKELVKF